MVFPFVRELLADAEHSPGLLRVASHLKGGSGRIRVSGLTPTAKALHLALLHRAIGRPLIVLVGDNRAAEELLPVLQAFCELTGAASPESIAYLPARDVLPFENLSPHPEIQQARAKALWRIAGGTASMVVTPIAAAAIRLRDAEFYLNLARVVRRNDGVDLDSLVQHLNTTGYSATDVVEMEGDYAVRGGILDVYPPELDRPLRLEFFGDEIESIRKFDPATQRSAGETDEAVLLPFTETPVTEELLAGIHTRLSGRRISGDEEAMAEAVREGGVSVFPGWEFFAPAVHAHSSLFDLLPTSPVLSDEPEVLARDLDAWWERVAQAHERSGIGNLIRPQDIYLPPEHLASLLAERTGAGFERLGVAGGDREIVEIASQPSQRFHGAVPAMLEEVKKLTAAGQRVMIAAGTNGELERLADIFNEYAVPYRLGTPLSGAGSGTYAAEAGYLGEDFSAATLVRAFLPAGVALPESRLVLFGANDLFEEEVEVETARAPRSRSKTAAFLSDFRDLAVGDYVVHVEHGIGQYLGLREIA